MPFSEDGYFSSRDHQLAAEREAELDRDAANERAFRDNPEAFRQRMGRSRSHSERCNLDGLPLHEVERYCRACAATGCAQRDRILSDD